MKKVTTLETILKAMESMELRITKSVNKGFQAVENRFDKIDKRFERIEGKVASIEKQIGSIEEQIDSIDTRIDNVEKRVHGTELGINRIEMLHFKKIEHFENDMLKFRTELAKANIIKSNAPMHP